MGDALDEHFNYLSDPVRLERFEAAVARAVRRGDRVADIGCGFGILGLLCLKAGAARVWGIDRTDAIEIARETMARSGFADRYTCIHDSSFRVDLPERAEVVICEHVGYFGFDYGIVRTLGDARRRFLKPGGKIIPGQIALQVAAAQSPECRKLAEAWASQPVPAEYHWLRDYGVNTRHPRDFAPDEFASPPAELGRIDLGADNPEQFSFKTRLEIARDAALDGLAGWFACEIADDVWMTNSPLADDRINRTQVFLPFASPLPVTAGDAIEVAVSIRHEDSLIAWTARVERTGQTARQSTWKSTILLPQDKVPAAKRIPHLTGIGAARKTLLELVDGDATYGEIAAAMQAAHPSLFPTGEEIARFVRMELARSAR